MTEQSIGRKLILAALSGLLLTLAFPRWNLWPLAWAGLVPLLSSLERSRNRREAFLFGFTAGFVFFLLSISWLRHVTVFGMFFVVMTEAVYWGMFGIFYHVVGAGPRARPGNGQPRGVAPTFVLSGGWVALEFIRSEIPVWGFGWNLLGASQAPNLWIAQLASVGGVYSISFLVFLGNAVIYSLWRGSSSVEAATEGRPDPGQPQGVAPTFGNSLLFLFLLLAVLLFGWSRIQAFSPHSFFRVSVLQGNIPQLLKWDPAYRRQILRIYLNLTELASFDAPQMIVWPEAAYPGFFNREPLANRVKERIRKIKIPVLVGSPHADEKGYYNSTYLLGSSGEVMNRYDKIRLVPFGEYVPWKPIFGFLEPFAYALGVSDFSPGRDFTVFELPPAAPPILNPGLELTWGERVRGVRFSTLICFEDTFPNMARQFVSRGADFLFVLTNDAWFGHSSAPYQHLQASQLRAVENGVSIVRAANTGVSAFITPLGEVVERVHNQEGKDTFVMGGTTYPVALAKEETIFKKGGWVFPYICLVISVIRLWRDSIPKRGRSNL